MSYSEWMEGTGTVIDERAAMIATAVVLAVGLVIAIVRHRDILIRHKKVKTNTVSTISVSHSEALSNQALGGKASGQ